MASYNKGRMIEWLWQITACITEKAGRFSILIELDKYDVTYLANRNTTSFPHITHGLARTDKNELYFWRNFILQDDFLK